MDLHLTAVFDMAPVGYVGYLKEVPCADTQADTLDEARENLAEAVELVTDYPQTRASGVRSGVPARARMLVVVLHTVRGLHLGVTCVEEVPGMPPGPCLAEEAREHESRDPREHHDRRDDERDHLACHIDCDHDLSIAPGDHEAPVSPSPSSTAVRPRAPRASRTSCAARC